MTGSIILDIIIGLVFIYLLYSLFATILQEIISTQLSLRAKVLEKAIIRMMEDGKSTTGHPIKDRFVGWHALLFRRNLAKQDMRVVKTFYNHPLIKYLGEDNFYNKPAYINSSNFSKVIVDMFRGTDMAATPEKFGAAVTRGEITDIVKGDVIKLNLETKAYLRSLWVDASGDVEKFREKVERWFDDTMERATGWYKKYIQLILFFIGISLAAVFNVDTIQIARNLSRDPKLREQVVNAASSYLRKNTDLKDKLQKEDSITRASLSPGAVEFQERTSDLLAQANKLLQEDINTRNKQLAIGWEGSELIYKTTASKWMRFLGWMITAFAISLGAPFWFDMLNKLMKVRGAGAKVPTAREEKAETMPQTVASPVTTVNVSNELEVADDPENMIEEK